jgi:ATP-binding cassette, subfamily B, bacterial
VRYAWLIAAAGVVVAAFTGIRRYLAFREARLAEAILRDRMFAHLQRLHFAFHDGQQTGQLMSRANTDLQQIQNAVVLVPLTIANLATVLAVLVVLVLMDPVLTVLALGLAPARELAGQALRHQAPADHGRGPAGVGGAVGGGRGDRRRDPGGQGVRRRGDPGRPPPGEADDLYDVSMRAARIRSTYWPALELLPNVGLIMVLGYGGHQVMAGELALGSLVAFNAYVVLLVWPLRMLGWIVAMAQRAAASAQRVHEVLATEPLVVSPAHPTPAAGHRAARCASIRCASGTWVPSAGARRVRPRTSPRASRWPSWGPRPAASPPSPSW